MYHSKTLAQGVLLLVSYFHIIEKWLIIKNNVFMVEYKEFIFKRTVKKCFINIILYFERAIGMAELINKKKE